MRKFLSGFVYAFRGVLRAVAAERNLKIHLLAMVLVTAAGFFFRITRMEWIVVLGCFSIVISLELINTAIELLANKLHPEHDDAIGQAKDVAAGAVLVAAFFSAIIGLLIFTRHFIS